MKITVPVIRRLIALHILGERLGQTRNELSNPFNRDDPGNRAMHLLLGEVHDWVVSEVEYEWKVLNSILPETKMPTKSHRNSDKANHPGTRRYLSE